MEIDTTTATPDKPASLDVYNNAEYWVDAKIRVNGNTSSAYNSIDVRTLEERERLDFDIPERQMSIIAGAIIIIGIVGIVLKRR